MTKLSDLFHHGETLSGGGEVLVLNPGAVINAESQAMLGALHSRSPGGIRSHLETLSKKGSANFMSSFYVGYGHKSIGDMGEACVFIEGVSMLAAKAVQDFPLYNGQEVSTRYVDFSKQRFVNPLGNEQGADILEKWREFYLYGLDVLIPVLRERFPAIGDESTPTYEKAIKAHAFDIMRGFLPAGASTNLCWAGPLRQFADRLPILRHHPLPEVREIGEAAEKALLAAYPNSFALKRYEATEQYLQECGHEYAYFSPFLHQPMPTLTRDNISGGRMVNEFEEAFKKRPPKTELPYRVRECGTAEFQFQLDFGSFRDLQRQRSLTMPMPILSSVWGFEDWYLDQLPEDLRHEAGDLIDDQVGSLHDLASGSLVLDQYYLPMGFKVPVRMIGDLRAHVYVVELRATRFVHPTLRIKMVDVAEVLLGHYGQYGLVLHLDQEPNRFDVRRGTHDIVEKV